jgi:putative SOS response-associated peptidase YedK
MCGRFTLYCSWSELVEIYGLTGTPQNIEPRYNIAPTQPVLAVRFNPKTGERTLDPLRWGLVPHWAKDLKFGTRCINARGETLSATPAFRDAVKARRCLIPASAFYEWKKTGTAKQPFAIVPTDGPVFAFAGLWENWRDKTAGEGTEWIRTCAIVTAEPNELVAPIHDRMPVILPREAWPAWLGETEATSGDLQALLKPYPAGRMRAYPISSRVNSVKIDERSLLAPVSVS